MTKGSFVFGGWYKEAGLTSQWDFGTDRGVSHPGADFTLKEECMSDFIPAKDAEFETFFKHYCQYVNAKCSPPDAPQWGHIPADPIDSRHGFFHPILPLHPQIAYQFPQFPGMPVFDKCEGNAGKLRFGGDGRIQTGVSVDLQEILDG
jgi:hypothetical protein